MKLLPAASSFLFVIFFILLASCKTDIVQEQKASEKVIALELQVYKMSQDRKYDSAIFFGKKMLYHAKKENTVSFIKKAYYRLSHNYLQNKQYDSALYYGDELYKLAASTNDTINMAEGKNRKGFVLKKIDSLELSLENFTDAEKLFLEIGEITEAGKKSLEIANVFNKIENFGAAELSATQGLKLLEDSKEFKTIVGLYIALITSSRELNRIESANDHANRGINLITNYKVSKQKINTINIDNAKEIKDSIDTAIVKKVKSNYVGMLLNGKANVLRDLKKYDEAIDYYKLAAEYYTKDTLEIKRTQFNLAYTLFLKDGYTKLSDSLLSDSYQFYKKEDKSSEVFSTLLKLAVLYKDVDQDRSLAYLNEASKSAEKRNKEESIHEVLREKLEVSPNKEDINKYLVLDNKLRGKQEKLDYFYINNRFNFEDERSQKIQAESEKILAENKAARQKVQSLVLSLILVIFIVLVFFIYQRIKRRHKIEKVKTVHVTEARISTKVHDELANDLYELMTQLETTNPEKEVVLDKLDTIYNQARDISKQIQSIDTEKGYAEELSNLFRTYQSALVNVLLKRYDTDIWKGISSHVKITIYRVLQEFLTNMKKHSDASLVVVSIEKENKQLFIQYIDNGKGFTTEISKNGLRNAENRIHAIEGKLTFDTELHKGCKFSINVPV
ncbi:MAG: ATP-binding protein [Bacteroidota bacterium]